MPSVTVAASTKEASIQAVVIRCGCGDPASHPDAVCPRPRATEDLGTIAYYHKNPLRRWLWAARHKL